MWGGAAQLPQESQTAAPDTEGSHVLMLKPSLVKDRVTDSETCGPAKWWVQSGASKGLPRSWPVGLDESLEP